MAALPQTSKTPTVQKLAINPDEVREAIELEHAISFREALSLYPKAIGWSFYFSLGVIMLGKIQALLHIPRCIPNYLGSIRSTASW
jgi:SP family general alpha glucoside:H+ symporter-like MFS transporter